MMLYTFFNNIGLPIRLANGTNEKEGRVEIYWNNQWSTVCDDLWDDNDATVICKRLGYSRGSARVSAYFGEGSGLILLDNVNCGVSGSNIFDCNHKFEQSNCLHNEDAGVVCYGEFSQGNLISFSSNNYLCIIITTSTFLLRNNALLCSETGRRKFT